MKTERETCPAWRWRKNLLLQGDHWPETLTCPICKKEVKVRVSMAKGRAVLLKHTIAKIDLDMIHEKEKPARVPKGWYFR